MGSSYWQIQLPVYRESIPLPFFDPYPRVLLVESCCVPPPCWPTWAWGKTLRLSDPVSDSPERSDLSAPEENKSCKSWKPEQHESTPRANVGKATQDQCKEEGPWYSTPNNVFSHSKRADKRGGPDPTKLNIYTLTHIHGPVQGAINTSELLWYCEIVETHRKQTMAIVHGDVFLSCVI